jgi:hypothetical protein
LRYFGDGIHAFSIVDMDGVFEICEEAYALIDVTQGQKAQGFASALKGEYLICGFEIADHIIVAEHDTLGIAGWCRRCR